MLQHEALSHAVIGAAIEVHKILGPGLLEAVYEECLCYELTLRGIPYQRQVPLPVVYKDAQLDCNYRMDLLIEETVVLELKAIDHVLPVHEAQLMTYLRLSGKPLGLLINFNVPALKMGITRRVI